VVTHALTKEKMTYSVLYDGQGGSMIAIWMSRFAQIKGESVPASEIRRLGAEPPPPVRAASGSTFPRTLWSLAMSRPVRQRMDFLNHALDALLRWPVAQISLAGFRRIHPSERVAQKIELPFRHLTDPCLLLVDREPQLGNAVIRTWVFMPLAPAEDR
jgi:hypothetical protein